MSTFVKTGKTVYCLCPNGKAEVEMGHGRTPYIIGCSRCGLNLHDIAPSGIGWHLGENEAIEIWNDYRKAVEALKERGQRKPDEKHIREYMYREAKGWGHNPG